MTEKIKCGYRFCDEMFEPRGNKKFHCTKCKIAEYNLLYPRIDVENPTQISMFKDVIMKDKSPTVPILNQPEGERLKEKGQSQIEIHSKEFLSRIREIAVSIAREKGQVCSDDLRVEAERLNIVPGHVNAWGAVFKMGCFIVVDRKKSSFVKSHAREIKVWGLKK